MNMVLTLYFINVQNKAFNGVQMYIETFDRWKEV